MTVNANGKFKRLIEGRGRHARKNTRWQKGNFENHLGRSDSEGLMRTKDWKWQ